jgi:hypothetical protein
MKRLIYSLIVLLLFNIGNTFAAAQKKCNSESIIHIRSAWFALNTYYVDNASRQNVDQSFSYGDLSHFVYDASQMIHIFDESTCYEVIQFLVELKSYSMVGGAALGEDTTYMISRRPIETRKAASSFLGQSSSPCLQYYENSKSELLNKPESYCASIEHWKEFLLEYANKPYKEFGSGITR